VVLFLSEELQAIITDTRRAAENIDFALWNNSEVIEEHDIPCLIDFILFFGLVVINFDI
jgi:hypothetical protein